MSQDARTLPHDLGLERSLIVAALVDPASIDEAMAILEPGDFYPKRHQRIIGTLFQMHRAGEPVDLVTATAACNGQREYLFELVDSHPVATSVTHYSEKVRALSRRRRLWTAATRLSQTVVETDDEDLITKAVEEVDNATGKRTDRPTGLKPYDDLKINPDEWTHARLTPKCIVKNLLYVDVGELAGPGGTGKTTLILWESVHIILGRHLYGQEVVNPGKVIFLTAEDRRERLVARCREVCMAMDLNDIEMGIIRDNLLIVDVVGEGRKLIEYEGQNLKISNLPDQLAKFYADDPPAMLIIDPTASFGADEGKVFENFQMLVEAGRKICTALGCCVRFIHHTGQDVARAKIVDQYAGRGGTALPDGCRMVSILKTYDPLTDKKCRPPAGCTVSPDSAIFSLHRPKLSYSPPNLPTIWIRRTGYAFEYFTEYQPSDEQKASALKAQIVALLKSKEQSEIYLTKSSLAEGYLENFECTKAGLKTAIVQLLSEGRLFNKPVPAGRRHGGLQEHLSPTAPDQAVDLAE